MNGLVWASVWSGSAGGRCSRSEAAPLRLLMRCIAGTAAIWFRADAGAPRSALLDKVYL